MGDSYDGGDANDMADSGASADSTDSGDDSSAFTSGDSGETGDGSMQDSYVGEGSGYSESAGEGSVYTGDGVSECARGDRHDGIDAEISEHTETDEPGYEGDDESAYEDTDTPDEMDEELPEEIENEMPDEMSQELPEEVVSETPDETETDWDGDDESAFEQQEEGEPQEERDIEIPVEQDLVENEEEPRELSEEEWEALQKQADQAAQEYNDKYSPYERAVSKGVEGVTETPNGGVSFEHSDALYTTEDGEKGIVTIEATGNRTADFDAANKALGLSEQPEGYTWHHLDNYNAKDNTITMELVRSDAHSSSKPHAGGCAQYDAVHGPTYNPPKQ